MNESDAEMCNLYNATSDFHPTAPFSYPSFFEGPDLSTPTKYTETKHKDDVPLYYQSPTDSSSASPTIPETQSQSLIRLKKQDLLAHLRCLNSEIRKMQLSFERTISAITELKKTISAELANTNKALQIVREYHYKMYDGDENFPESLEIARRLCGMSDSLQAERDEQERSIRDLTERMRRMEIDYEDDLQEKLDERAELRADIRSFVHGLGDCGRGRMMTESEGSSGYVMSRSEPLS